MATTKTPISGGKPLATVKSASDFGRWPHSVVLASPVLIPTLTASELALLASFRSMNDRSQAFIGRFAVAQAERCPRRSAPLLRLVKCVEQ